MSTALSQRARIAVDGILPFCATICMLAHGPAATAASAPQPSAPGARVLVQRGPADTTPPVLTYFNAPSIVDLSKNTNPVEIKFTATDDLSGVGAINGWARGPGNQSIWVESKILLPAKKVSAILMSEDSTSDLQPGAYTFQEIDIWDVAGNMSVYGPSALAALGNTTFTVRNKQAFDAQPPALESGQVVTPVVSLSSNHPGTNQPPFVGVTMNAVDAGGAALAGVRYAQATFCNPDGSHCLTLYSYESSPHGVANAKGLQLGYQLNRTLDVPDVYELQLVVVNDYAGNQQYLTSDTTDFSKYFPSTTIEIDP